MVVEPSSTVDFWTSNNEEGAYGEEFGEFRGKISRKEDGIAGVLRTWTTRLNLCGCTRRTT